MFPTTGVNVLFHESFVPLTILPCLGSFSTAWYPGFSLAGSSALHLHVQFPLFLRCIGVAPSPSLQTESQRGLIEAGWAGKQLPIGPGGMKPGRGAGSWEGVSERQ